MRFEIAAVTTVLMALAAAPRPVVAQEAQRDAVIEVQNNLDQPVTVFMERGRFDRRLGVVEPFTTDTIDLPAWLATERDEIALFVVRKDGTELGTDLFPLHPGAHIGLIVPTPPPAKEVIYAALPADELSKTTLTVENQEDRDVVVFAEEGEFQLRLGTVKADSTATLEFPAGVVRPDDSIMILVERRGELALESYPIQLHQGEHVGLRLQPKRAHRPG